MLTPIGSDRTRREAPPRGILLLLLLLFFSVGTLAPSFAEGPVTPFALHRAARDGNLPEVRRLLDAGVPPDAGVPSRTECPLFLAANQGYLEIVDLLLDRGADPECRVGDWTPLRTASRAGHLPVVRRLLAEGPGATELAEALREAAKAGHPRTVRTLAAAGAPLGAAAEDGTTPLHLAARNGRPETVRALSELGAALDAVDAAGRSALHWASWQRFPDVVRVLLARGAAVDLEDARGDRPFLGAEGPAEAVGHLEAAARRSAEIASCPVLPLPAFGPIAEADPAVRAWGAPSPPPNGTVAWGLPPSGRAALPLRLTTVRKDPCAGRWFDLDLELPHSSTPGADPAGDWMVLVGATDRPLRRSAVERIELPWGLFPETVDSAADLDGDSRADAIVRSHCCGAEWDPGHGGLSLCDYTCWDSWIRDPEKGWLRCARGGPC